MKKIAGIIMCSLFSLLALVGCSSNNESGDYNTDQSVDVTVESKILTF